jgi:hypothetical protein
MLKRGTRLPPQARRNLRGRARLIQHRQCILTGVEDKHPALSALL